MGNARNLANLLSGGDVKIKADDIEDGSINTDKLDGSITGAKFADGSVNLETQSTGTLGSSNGGFGLTSLGTAGQALQVNSGGTAFEFVDKTADLTDLQKDIAVLALNDAVEQSKSSDELTSNISDVYANEDAVTSKSNIVFGGGTLKCTGTLSGTTTYINPFGTTGTFSTTDGQSHSAVTITTGTGAHTSGGTSFDYIDIVTSAPGSGGWFLIPQGTTYDWPSTKVVMTFQVITKAGGGGPFFKSYVLKGVATDWTSYGLGDTSALSARPGAARFNNGSSVGNQARMTYDPFNNEDVIVGESRSTNSGTFSAATETYGTNFATLTASATGVLYGITAWKDSNPNWTVRMWTQVTPSNKEATGSYTSTTNTVTDSVTQMSCVIVYKNQAGTATLNTDLKVSLSADNGSNFTQVTLTATNTSAIATNHITATSNKVTVTAGTQLKYKVEFANQSTSKDTRIQGISMIF